MSYKSSVGFRVYKFESLKELLAKASAPKSGDRLASVGSDSHEERVAARMALSEVPLKRFLSEAVVPYEEDECTRLFMDSHDLQAFSEVSALTVGDFRNRLLSDRVDSRILTRIAAGLTPEMVAAVSKLMQLQDLITVARKCRVVTRFRNTIGLEGRFFHPLAAQPSRRRPARDRRRRLRRPDVRKRRRCHRDQSCDGTTYTPAGSSSICSKNMRLKYEIPTQSCVLAHVTTILKVLDRGAPVDLVFQSVGGTQKTNDSFGIDLAMLGEAREAATGLKRGALGTNVMYF